MIFEIPGQPQGKQRARVTMKGGYATAYTPEKTANYENLIKVCYYEGKDITLNGLYDCELEMSIIAEYSVPKSFSKKKRTAALSMEINPVTKPDIDNVIKVVCDALNKVAYNDDTQIVKLTAVKRYSAEPKVIVSLEPIR